MKMEQVPSKVIAWESLPVTEMPGETGMAKVRTAQSGELYLRRITFSPGYRSDHWCAKGHLALVLEGSLSIEFQDGRSFEVAAGSSFQIGDGDGLHRAWTRDGAEIFIVD
jgi:quercetin dioxygenase-like cupin family protein